MATITFNAWQYVETDLWAALLYRVFDKLSPEARQKLSEYDKAKKKAQQQASSQAAIVTKAEKVVAALALQETTDADEADEAEVDLNRAQQQAAEVRTVLMTRERSGARTARCSTARSPPPHLPCSDNKQPTRSEMPGRP